MDLRLQLLLKTLIALIVIFVFGRTILPLITDYFLELFGNKKKKEPSGNIEIMIAQKKRLFETVGSGPSHLTKSEIKNTNKSTSLKDKCLNKFKSLSKKSRSDIEDREFSDLKKLMKLMDSFQWGDGPELKKASSDIKSKTTLTIPTTFISKQVQFQLEEKVNNASFSFSRFMTFSKAYSFCYYIFSQNLERIFSSKVSSLDIQRQSISLFYNSFSNLNISLSEIIKDKFSLRTQSEAKVRQVANTISKKHNLEAILKKINENAVLLKSLAPLPTITKRSSIEEALVVFSLKQLPTKEAIKKIYREHVSIYHPDKFNNKKLDKEIEANIHNNFLSIQGAYDIILSEI